MIFLSPERTAKLARLTADRALLRFANGLQLLIDGSATPVGNTPRDRILKQGKLEVFRYRPPERQEFELGHDTLVVEEQRFPVPVLLVPPLMVRPYIYDLRPEHSFVRALLRAGFEVYLVDFGVPDRNDVGVKLDHYVLDYLPSAVAAVRERSGARDLTLCGYCMGGVFSLLHAATWRDAGVRNLVSIAGPTDFAKMGALTWMARVGHPQTRLFVDLFGNVPGFISSEGLKWTAPLKRLTRYADLFINLWNEEYVRGHDAMSKFTSDFIPYPRDAFKQFLKEMMVENRLKDGLRFGDRTAEIGSVRSNLLLFAARDDTIVPPSAARPLLSLVASTDKEYREVPGGHLGVMAGSKAPEAVWQPTIEWLRTRSLRSPECST